MTGASTLPEPPDSSRARRTYDALLAATTELLDEGGYPAATTTAIAARAGVGVGTFYRYFPDRDVALATSFGAALDETLAAVATQLDLGRLLDHGLEAVLARVVEAVLGGYRRHAATIRAALLQLGSTPAIRQVYWDRHARSLEVVATFLRRAQRAGAVRDGDPDVLAQALLVLVQGLNSPVLLARPSSRSTRSVTSELVRAIHTLLAPAPSVISG